MINAHFSRRFLLNPLNPDDYHDGDDDDNGDVDDDVDGDDDRHLLK